MLVLSRRVTEQIVIDVDPAPHSTRLTVKLMEIRGNHLRIGFEVSPDLRDEEGKPAVVIHREEIRDAIDKEASNGTA